MSVEAKDVVWMGKAQLSAVLAELEAALDGLEQLAHLCSIQAHAGRVEESVGAALHILRTAPRMREEQSRPVAPAE